jgi:hypothetical protein
MLAIDRPSRSSPRLILKQRAGWFAAGQEVQLAMKLLSDAGFKLFMWVSLHAERCSGILKVLPGEIALLMQKREEEIGALIEELLVKEICHSTTDGVVVIADRFWPYERTCSERKGEKVTAYVEKVRRRFLQHSCVRSTFTVADEMLTVDLYCTGVSIETVERAIVLGCLRKYAALLRNESATPIASLRYFTGLLAEVEKSNVSGAYWEYTAKKVRKLETEWRRRKELSPVTAV